MTIVESQSDSLIHLTTPGSTTALCGKTWHRPLPHIPLHLFGVVELLEDGTPDMPWCPACTRKHRPSGNALYHKHLKTMREKGVVQ